MILACSVILYSRAIISQALARLRAARSWTSPGRGRLEREDIRAALTSLAGTGQGMGLAGTGESMGLAGTGQGMGLAGTGQGMGLAGTGQGMGWPVAGLGLAGVARKQAGCVGMRREFGGLQPAGAWAGSGQAGMGGLVDTEEAGDSKGH
jgi:hypothetical protein